MISRASTPYCKWPQMVKLTSRSWKPDALKTELRFRLSPVARFPGDEVADLAVDALHPLAALLFGFLLGSSRHLTGCCIGKSASKVSQAPKAKRWSAMRG